MDKKKILQIILPSTVFVIICVAGGIKLHDWYIWHAPAYDSTEKQVLLSSKIDKLTDEQENAFWEYAHAVAHSEFKVDDKNVANEDIEDESLLVKKSNEKHKYDISYVCKVKTSDTTIKCSSKFTLETHSSLKDDEFKYSNFTSNFYDKLQEYYYSEIEKSLSDLSDTLSEYYSD